MERNNPLIDYLKDEDLSIKRLFENRKLNYTSNIEDDFELLKSEIPKGYLIHFIQLNFIIENNNAGILIQNFVQQYLERPMFKNNIIIENTTNDSVESYKICLQLLPYEIIVAESKIPFFNFLIENSLDKYNEVNYNQICGFYINCHIKSNMSLALALDNYLTPFIIVNDEVVILEKNPILKKWIYQYIERDSKNNVFRGIYISGDETCINKKIITSLKNVLGLKEDEDELTELFNNNNILIRNQKRETSDISLLTTLIYPDKNVLNSLNRVIFSYYFTIDKNKQKNRLLNIVEHSIKLLKIYIEECVTAFNSKETTHNHIFTDVNKEVSKTLSQLKKKQIDKKYTCYNISPRYNVLFKFICENNDIEFGSNSLCVDKNVVLDYKNCFEKLDEFYEIFSKNLDTFFENQISSLLELVSL